MEPEFLSAEWRDLAMVNFEVDPLVLADLVPPGTELDKWRGRTLVSMVGFRFLKTKVLGLSVPGHRDFEEVNLRFYVRRRMPGGWRRGVVFVKELVPRRAIAWIARVVYNENYVAMPMRHSVAPQQDAPERHVAYEWRLGRRWCRLGVVAVGSPELPPTDSEEVFVTEHYWGYAKQRRGPTREYQVEHPQWRVSRGKDAVLDCDVATLYGPRFSEFLLRKPTSAFVADGSPVIVRKGVTLDVGAV